MHPQRHMCCIASTSTIPQGRRVEPWAVLTGDQELRYLPPLMKVPITCLRCVFGLRVNFIKNMKRSWPLQKQHVPNYYKTHTY
jgi:hypothetical protein